MNSQDEDRDLRETFASQRLAEDKQVTEFHRLVEAARVDRVRQRRALAPVALVATVLVALGLVIGQALQHSEPVAPPATAPYLAAWTAPTAFLLRTPGHDLVSTLPAFARAAPALDPDARHPLPPQTPAKQERSSTP